MKCLAGLEIFKLRRFLQENQGKWPYLGPKDIKLENI